MEKLDRMETNELVCRRSCLTDRSAIAEMVDTVYDGLDYLDAFYSLYMKQNFRYCFVAEKNGKVVSYIQFTVLDELLDELCRTGVRQAARTAAQHRGKGFYKILENYSTMQINFLCPNLEQWAYTAYWNTFEKKRISNPELGYQLIDKRYWKVYIIKETNAYLNTVHPGNNGLPTQTEPMYEINIDEAEGILKDPDNKERLVPSGSLCSSWEPFSVDDGLRTNLTAIYTRSSVWGTKIDGDCRALSTGTIYECPKGLMYDLDYYGQEFKQLKAHILSHVKHALEESNMNRQLYLCVFCPFEMSLADLDEFMLKDMGWKPEPTDETAVYVTITKRL